MKLIFKDFPTRFILRNAMDDNNDTLACEFGDLREFVAEIEKVTAEIKATWPVLFSVEV